DRKECDMAAADTLYDEASALKEKGDLQGAVGKLREAVAADPGHVLSHTALAVHLQRLGPDFYREAIEHAQKVVELEPNDSFSYTQLSVVAQRCGQIQLAEDAKARAHTCGGHQH
ncbi:MAG TPA: hypothetical protein VM165_21615, partial [Planctomycetaceae bacterium]|nr:hypothetical protein [Planctomycetaceae bacterium]